MKTVKLSDKYELNEDGFWKIFTYLYFVVEVEKHKEKNKFSVESKNICYHLNNLTNTHWKDIKLKYEVDHELHEINKFN